MASKLCLNMIVKNEAAILPHCLMSVVPYLTSYAVLDTGSTDGTPDLIRDFMLKHSIPGAVVCGDFQNFGQARNDALDLFETDPYGSTHALLLDADMTLCADDEEAFALLADLAPEPDAFLIPQIAGVLRYHNTRVLRRAAGARYVGATHEYLSVPNGFMPRLDRLHFHDHQNGSNRPEKYTRDEALLLQELEENPANGRAMFYLAQTYREMGRHADALRYYEARAAAPGWEEEGWYARFQTAVVHQSMGNIPAAIQAATTAYARRPSRLEPVHFLAKLHRERGENEAAAQWANLGLTHAQVPQTDILFVDTYPAEYGLREELSIAGYYLPEHHAAAERACLDLTFERSAPDHTRHLARQNSRFYAKSITEIVPGAKVWCLEKPRAEVPHWNPSNPSILARSDGTFLVNVRYVNYRIDDAGRYVYLDPAVPFIRTRNEMLVLDEALGPVDRRAIRTDEYTAPFPDAAVQGFEDLRLFKEEDGIVFGSATVRDHDIDAKATMVLLDLEKRSNPKAPDYLALARVTRLEPSTEASTSNEKNWMPLISSREGATWVVHVDPFVTVTYFRHEKSASAWKHASNHRGYSNVFHGGDLRGSSQAVLWGKNEHIAIVHEAIEHDGRRTYLHRWIVCSEDGVTRMSDPFFFVHRGIEFCAGLARAPNGDLIASFGVNDGEAWLARVPEADVRSLLRPG